MNINKYLDKIRDTESTEAYFWAIETAYQLGAISAEKYDECMYEYRKLEAERAKKLMERFR